MDLKEFQELASRTNRIGRENNLIVSLLGLSGEAGSLLTEYKKFLRDGRAHSKFSSMVAEELGDILWYISNIATHMHMDLSEIAMMNVVKAESRWGGEALASQKVSFLDESYLLEEQFPRNFSVSFEEIVEDGKRRVHLSYDGTALGDRLTDNSYEDDGYRFHDVFHLSYAAVLSWSPVVRKLMGRKRRSDPLTDEVEDGGRAQVIEEAVSAYTYEYARKHASLEGVHTLDYVLLRTIKDLTSGLEVSRVDFKDWQKAILDGFSVWREMVRNRGGVVVCDLNKRTVSFRKS